MRYLLTTCCAEKSPEPEPMPAEERYLSPRIALARGEAAARRLPLLILSGVYGVLEAGEGVPWYDHALLPEEVPALLPGVVARLRELDATALLLVVRPRGTPGWAPYLDLLDAAAAELGLTVERVLVDVE